MSTTNDNPFPLVVSADGINDGTETASTHRRTPDGIVPGRVAGYIVGECTVLCADCGRDHPDVTEHPETTDARNYSYDYLGGLGEADFPGNLCEECGRRLDTNVLLNSLEDVQDAGLTEEVDLE